jgi:hypothetical protein
MANDGDNLTEIKVGDIGGNLSGNITGRDINIRQTTQAVPANKDEALTELKQLLAHIQQQIAEIIAQQEVLGAISL